MQELPQRLKLRSYAKDNLVAPQQPEMNVIEIPEIEYDNVPTQWSLNKNLQSMDIQRTYISNRSDWVSKCG